MSPTLLELTVAILLLFLAWQIGVLIAPRVLAAFISFWRSSRPPIHSDKWGPEKNVTPPPVPGDKPSQTHGYPHK